MNYLKPVMLVLILGLIAASSTATSWAEAIRPPKEPAKILITVTPDAVAAGSGANLTLRLEPKSGIKINRYPKIKLELPAQAGLVDPAKAEIGNDSPPPPDNMESNYYKTVDPLSLNFNLAPSLGKGTHELDGKLVYFYCVTASNFCAPARVPVKIPVTVQ